MGRNGFTLIEIAIVVVLVGILATVGYPIYENVIEASRQKVCESNLRALTIAVEQRIKEGKAPATLGALPKETMERAYAQVLQQKGAWKIKVAQCILKAQQPPMAYAQGALITDNPSILVCPSKNGLGPSYALHKNIENTTYEKYMERGNGFTVIGDCDDADGDGKFSDADTDLAEDRHYIIQFVKGIPKKKTFALAISKEYEVWPQFKNKPTCTSPSCTPSSGDFLSITNKYDCRFWCHDKKNCKDKCNEFCCRQYCNKYSGYTFSVTIPSEYLGSERPCKKWCNNNVAKKGERMACKDLCPGS